MSSGELLLILLVALIVFGPTKLPMVATHLGQVVATMSRLKKQLSSLWEQKLLEIQLEHNEQKAKKGDQEYHS